MEKKTVCLISQYLIGHEVKHSSLQEEKISHLKYKIPFLETEIVPHLLYWACQGCILFHAIFYNPDKIDSSTMCQLLFVNLVRFGCQLGFRVYMSRQSNGPSCTQIGWFYLVFFSFALGSQPFPNLGIQSVFRIYPAYATSELWEYFVLINWFFWWSI